MSKALFKARSPLSYINLNGIAKKTKFITRNSKKFSAHSILTALMKCVITGKGSFREIASFLTSLERKSISRQGVFKRINSECVEFLSQTAYAIIASQAKTVQKICSKSKIKRILTEDSTFQNMNSANAGNFPAHGNSKGRTAGFKMDIIYDLLTGKPIFQGLFSGTQQDKKTGSEILKFIKKGDLILRDMGYFSHAVFMAIKKRKGHWLSRLPANVKVLLADGSKLEKKLRSRSNKFIDEEVLVGDEGLRCRLVAARADDKLAQKRRRNRIKSSKNKPSQQSLVRDGWHILLTNLDDEMKSEELFEIYRLRWNVEVRFKAWKQSINMKSVFKTVSNYDHLQALIYAALIFQLITLNLAAKLEIGDRVVSLENFSSEIASRILEIVRHTKTVDFTFDSRHILMEKRKRKPLMDQILTT